jgi:hypothetical protein
MKRSMLTITSAVCAAGLIAIIVGSHTLSAQDEHADKGDNCDERHRRYADYE